MKPLVFLLLLFIGCTETEDQWFVHNLEYTLEAQIIDIINETDFINSTTTIFQALDKDVPFKITTSYLDYLGSEGEILNLKLVNIHPDKDKVGSCGLTNLHLINGNGSINIGAYQYKRVHTILSRRMP